jgi:DNA-binding NarL/FixJ family response regulator
MPDESDGEMTRQMARHSFPYIRVFGADTLLSKLAMLMMSTMPHVLLVDDHQILRQGLRALLDVQPDLRISEADTGRAAVSQVHESAPDVVVMDLAMPVLNGIDATRQFNDFYPRVKVIALSAHSDKRMIAEAMRAGASGFVPKDAAFEELANAIRQVLAGKVYISPKVAMAVRDAISDSGQSEHASSMRGRLTPREREVLQLLAEGKSTKEVAAVLHVGVKTVETHRRQMMEKLQMYSLAELTKYAIREGITSVEQ